MFFANLFCNVAENMCIFYLRTLKKLFISFQYFKLFYNVFNLEQLQCTRIHSQQKTNIVFYLFKLIKYLKFLV